MSEYDEPWSWIPHIDGVDRQVEINAYLRKMLEVMPIAKGPMMRWNPETSSMEAFKYTDDQSGQSAAPSDGSKESK